MAAFRLIASWALALVLIAFFLHVTVHPWSDPTPGYVKFYDAPGDHVVFSAIAEGSGLSLFEPAGRFVAGVLELLAALLVLLPISRRAGAGLAALLLGSGVAIHLSPWLGRELPLPEGGTDGGTHFLVYIVFLVFSLLLMLVHPAERSRY
ncbi:MAG: hypothetical protein ACO33A_10195 [Hyphomonas sp.]